MEINRFTLRVYGIMIENGQVLLSDEKIEDRLITKFPGGGLQYGEGFREALEREWLEETGTAIRVTQHFYTTDFFVPSMFNDGKQVIAVYYLVEPASEQRPKVVKHPFAFPDKTTREVFRWQDLETFQPEMVSLPIDRKVAAMLKRSWRTLPGQSLRVI